MSTTFQSIVSTLDQLNVRHFPNPANDAALLPYRTPSGDLLVIAQLQCDGEYLAFRTEMTLECDDESRLERLTAQENARARLVQLNASEDTVTASSGLWLMDGKLTPKTLRRYLDNLLGVASQAFGTIRENAGDPGGGRLRSTA